MHHIPMYILLAWAYISIMLSFWWICEIFLLNRDYKIPWNAQMKHVDINWQINLDFEDNAWTKFPEHFKDIR